MIDLLGIDITVLNWQQLIAIIAVIGALVLSIVSANNRLTKAKIVQRVSVVLLNIIAAFALLGFILKPSIETELQPIVRLNTTSEKLIDVNRPDYWLQSKTLDNATTNAIEIFDPQQILINHPNINQIEIIGDGLSESQWKGFPPLKINYQLPELKLGLINTEWNKQLNLGENLLISGDIQIPENSTLKAKNLTLSLRDPGFNIVAEKEVKFGERFSLQTQPKLAGNHQYILQVSETGSTQSDEPILEQPIHTSVKIQNNARILVIQSAPSFETKQLQNWAAENGAKFLVKTKISKNKYIQRKTNYSELTNTNISQQLFNNFDLVVVDGRGFIELSSMQKQWLTEAVAKGLGVLVLADESLLKLDDYPELLKGVNFKSLEASQQTSLSWLDNNNHWTIPTEFTVNPMAVSMMLNQHIISNSKKLIVNGNGSVIAIQYKYQLGRVAVNLFSQSHQWVTLGKAREHSEYWQNLIANIAATSQHSQLSDRNSQQLFFSKQLIPICVESVKPIENIVVTHEDQQSSMHQLLLQSVQGLSHKRCGYFWPEKSGWYKTVVSSSEVLSEWFYVEAEEEWLAHLQQQKIKSTLAKQDAYQMSFSNTTSRTPISLWIFWWLLVSSATLLWVERKFMTD